MIRRASRAGGNIWPAVLACVLFGAMASSAQAASPSEKEPRIAFLQLLESVGEFRIFIRDAGGLKPVSSVDYHVRELQVLSRNLLAVGTGHREKRRIYVVNLKNGKQRASYNLGKFEPNPLVSTDGTRLLTVRRRSSRYAIELVTIAPPFKPVKTVAYSKTGLSPRTWPCAGNAAFFLEREHDTSRVIRLDLQTGGLTDITPADLAGRDIHWISVSCDEKTVAVSANLPGKISEFDLYVYRGGARIKAIRNSKAIEPDVANDGSAVLYLAGYGKPKNRIMKFDLATGRISEIVGPVSAFSVPAFVE